MASTPHIDWDSEEKAINALNTITDEEVEQVLNAFDRAKLMYIDSPETIPERLRLTDKSGYPRYTITTHNGINTTVTVTPVYPYISSQSLIVLTALSFTIFVGLRYFSLV